MALDENLLRLIRLNNMFAPTELIGNKPPLPMDQPPVAPPYEPAQRLQELYKPETTYSDLYKQNIENIPQRNNPGIGRKLLAGMAGLSSEGQQAADDFLYRPYNQAVEAWKMKQDAITPGLTAERYSNANERTLANQAVGRELEQQRINETIRKNTAAEAHQRDLLEFQKWRAANPNGIAIKAEDGFVHLVNPQTGEETKTAIKHGELSDLEARNLKLEDSKVLTMLRGNIALRNQSAAEAERQKNRLALEGVQQGNRIEVKKTPSASSVSETSEKDMLPTQVKIMQYNKARELVNTNPELGKWIKLGDPGTNDFIVQEPGEDRPYWFDKAGPTPEQHKQISDAIYGTASSIPSGTVLVISPDGKKGYIPSDQLNEAIKSGYKKVQ
jgi:hypothetical protein